MIPIYVISLQRNSDIVKATGLSKQTLNSAIRKLEKDGIIILEKMNEKSKNSNDGQRESINCTKDKVVS